MTDSHLAEVGTYAVAGHYEEARTLLQRYLSRYPNILPAHLTLAAVYSELGQDAEARAEAAEVLRLNPEVFAGGSQAENAHQRSSSVGAAYCGVAQGGTQVSPE